MRIVLVDPSRTVLKSVARLLEARGDEVLPFTDAVQALRRLKEDLSVNALITSTAPLSMPGVELCWEARVASSNRRPIYIMMMSSSQERRNVIEALDCGADDFIGKPPAPEELYARLRVAERVSAMQRELITLATTDALTGVLNRRAFFERATDACARAGEGSLCAIMLDIDHFKRINDLFGHDAGDAVLVGIAQAAAAEAPIVGRMGGEEFVLLLENGGEAEATVAAERLRARSREVRPAAGASGASVTCSIGVSTWLAHDTIDKLLKRADVALYQAKALGRNRVVVSHSGERASDAA